MLVGVNFKFSKKSANQNRNCFTVGTMYTGIWQENEIGNKKYNLHFLFYGDDTEYHSVMDVVMMLSTMAQITGCRL